MDKDKVKEIVMICCWVFLIIASFFIGYDKGYKYNIRDNCIMEAVEIIRSQYPDDINKKLELNQIKFNLSKINITGDS